jgi:hypothetical protein
MHGKVFHAKIVFRRTPTAKYPPANGTKEPHAATSRNVEEWARCDAAMLKIVADVD